MSFRTFGGEFTRATKVSLSGKSKHEESREQVLERTRKEREQRKQNRLENRSANVIQAGWRSYHARNVTKSQVKAEWMAKYGGQGQHATSADLAADSLYLPQLCYFINPNDIQDVILLATACNLALSTTTVTLGTTSSQQPSLCRAAAELSGGSTPDAAAVIVARVCKLVPLCLECLATHRDLLSEHLKAPRHSLTSSSSAASNGVGTALELSFAASALIEAAIVLISPDSWTHSLGSTTAAAGAVQRILQHALKKGVFRKLFFLVNSSCSTAEIRTRAGIPAVETLCTAMVVRYFSIPAGQRADPCSSCDSGPAVLACIPLLLTRCPSLKPLIGLLWNHTVAALHEMPAARFISWLPTDSSQSGAGAATFITAALLGNLVDWAEAALSSSSVNEPSVNGLGKSQLAAKRTAALQFVKVVTTMLSLLPLSTFFPGERESAWIGEDEDDSDHDLHLHSNSINMYNTRVNNNKMQIDQTSTSYARSALLTPLNSTVPRLLWDEEELPPTELMNQLQKLVADPAVIQACVRAALPAANAESATSIYDNEPPAVLVQAATAARTVCSFVATVLQLPGAATSWLVSSAAFAQRLWFSYLRDAHSESNSNSGTAWIPSEDDSIDPGWMLPLALFSEAFSICLAVYGDEGLYEQQHPLPLAELYSDTRPRGVLSLLRFALWHTLWVEAPPSPGGWPQAAARLRSRFNRSAGRLLSQLHSRNGRRQFAPREAFYAESLPVERFQAEIAAGAAAGRDSEDPGASRAWCLLAYAPCLLPFKERARVFQSLVSKERSQYRTEDFSMFTGLPNPRQFITVRRGQVLKDAFTSLGSGSGADQLRGRVRVRFLSEQGLEEAGVDGGGIFKEFLGEVVRDGFDPELGLFKATTDNRMYPNPYAAQILPGFGLPLIEFLGRMVGKAMWEGILLELPLAYFFLKKFRGAACDVDDLPTLDPELHRHLLSLKSYSGDVSDLELSFTITNEAPSLEGGGGTQEVELVPGGRDIPVTSANAIAYIRRVADYRLNIQLREVTSAFLRGLHALVPRHWVSMFNEREIQELLSGAEGRNGIDIEDLKANVQYSGGYHEEHPIIQQFWLALESFTPQEQGELLKFVTSCPRPPLLGFKYLEPPFCIQMAGSVLEPAAVERLPTASTCMNLLKLPPYRTAAQIREKLLYAISAGAGFELS